MIRSLALAALILTVWTAGVHAQPQADPLGDCLTDSTTGRDRKDLATWLFLAMAAHPEIKEFAASRAAEASNQSAKVMGALVTRLLTDSCAEQAMAVAKAGQASAFVQAFRRLGELAMQELMADESVNSAVAQFQKYVDQERLKKIGQQ